MLGLGRRSPAGTTRARPARRSFIWGCAIFLFGTPLLATAAERPPYVTPAAVKQWLEEGKPVTFLDVREADEFAAAHLAGAINVVFDKVEALADRLPHDQPIILYCIHSSHRAPLGAQTLRSLGFTNAVVLDGGIVAWQAEGLTVRAADLAAAPQILTKNERCEEAKRLYEASRHN